MAAVGDFWESDEINLILEIRTLLWGYENYSGATCDK